MRIARILTSLAGVIFWNVARLVAPRFHARRLEVARKRLAAQAALSAEWKRITNLRSYRRALHYATTWKALNEHQGTQRLPRRTRRAAAREAAKLTFRRERGLPDLFETRGHRRRLRRAYYDPSVIMPIRREASRSTMTDSTLPLTGAA
ncbi:MAG TPA: hypothetical protein VF668_01235 [Pyrinomonadaceae bacterium]|jgi:hypothetical protein